MGRSQMTEAQRLALAHPYRVGFPPAPVPVKHTRRRGAWSVTVAIDAEQGRALEWHASVARQRAGGPVPVVRWWSRLTVVLARAQLRRALEGAGLNSSQREEFGEVAIHWFRALTDEEREQLGEVAVLQAPDAYEVRRLRDGDGGENG